MKQPTLVDVKPKPKLTARQAKALEILRKAGSGGMSPTKLGAWLHYSNGTHPPIVICGYCASSGNEVLRALRKKGLARQRRPRGLPAFWQATDLPPESMGDFPEGF